MRIMGVDYGDARTGIAMSDLLCSIVGSTTVIHSRKDEKTIGEIQKLIAQNGVTEIVVGLPKNMDGSIGFRGEATFAFIEELKKLTELPIITWDERLSTVSAIKSLNETNTRGKKRKEVVDTVAAMYILQNYLDSL